MGREILFPNVPTEKLPLGTKMTRTELVGLSRKKDINVPSIDFAGLKGNRKALTEAYMVELKPARNALAAMFLEEIAEEVTAERQANPPYGLHTDGTWLSRSRTEINDFNMDVADGMIHTWEIALDRWQKPLKEWVKTIPEDDLLTLDPEKFSFRDRMFAKFWYTTYVATKRIYQDIYDEPDIEGMEPNSFLHAGVNTGARFSTKFTRVGGEVYERDLLDPDFSTEENIAEMADVEALYPMTAWAAKLSLTHGPSIIKAIEKTGDRVWKEEDKKLPIKPDDYEYRFVGDRKILVPRYDISQLGDENGNEIFDQTHQSVRTGCPAMAAETEDFSDPTMDVNIIKYQLQWAAEIAKQTLFPQLASAGAK